MRDFVLKKAKQFFLPCTKIYSKFENIHYIFITLEVVICNFYVHYVVGCYKNM